MGVTDKVSERLAKIRRDAGGVEHKIKPLPVREAAPSFENYLVDHSNSKNLLRRHERVNLKSKQLIEKISETKLADLHGLQSASLNQMFEGTNFKLADLYSLKKQPRV